MNSTRIFVHLWFPQQVLDFFWSWFFKNSEKSFDVIMNDDNSGGFDSYQRNA